MPLKEEFLQLLREDVEFKEQIKRLITTDLATKDDIHHVLLELKHLREDFQRETTSLREDIKHLREDFNRMNTELKQLREDFQRETIALREDIKQLREDFNRMNAELKQLREDFNRMNAELKQLREDFNRMNAELKQLREDFQRETIALREDINRLDMRLSALGTRWGLMAEEATRTALREFFTKKLNVSVSSWETFDEEGVVFGKPTIVEVDIAVKNDEHWLIEYKASANKSDIAVLYRIGELYEKIEGKKPLLFLVSPYVDPHAKSLAKKLKITVYTT